MKDHRIKGWAVAVVRLSVPISDFRRHVRWSHPLPSLLEAPSLGRVTGASPLSIGLSTFATSRVCQMYFRFKASHLDRLRLAAICRKTGMVNCFEARTSFLDILRFLSLLLRLSLWVVGCCVWSTAVRRDSIAVAGDLRRHTVRRHVI